MPCGNRGVPALLEGVGAASELRTASRRDDIVCSRSAVWYAGPVLRCGFGAGVCQHAKRGSRWPNWEVEVPGPCTVNNTNTGGTVI
jgi:hypothetical protein